MYKSGEDKSSMSPSRDGERKSLTLSEIRYSVIRDNIICRVVSSTIGLNYSTENQAVCQVSAVVSIQWMDFSKTSLNVSAISLESIAEVLLESSRIRKSCFY